MQRLASEDAPAAAVPPAVRALAFACAAGVVLAYALNGGAYDAVVRGQFAVAIWWTLTLGLVVGVLPRTRPGLGLAVTVAAFAGLVVWTACGLAWSDSDERTTAEVARTTHHAGVLVLAWSALGRGTWTSAGAGLAAAAVGVTVLAFISRLAPDVLVADVYGPEGGKRLSYPFNYWNANAAWGAMTLAMVLAWSVHDRAVVRSLALAAVPVAVLATYLTYSRAGAIGLVAGLVLVVALSGRRWAVLVHGLLAAALTIPAMLVLDSHQALVEGTGTSGASSLALVTAGCALACACVPLATFALGLQRVRLGRRPARVALVAGALAFAVAGAVVAPSAADDAWDSFKQQGAGGETDPTQRLNLSGNRYDVYGSALEAAGEDTVRGLGAGTFEFWWNLDARDREFIRDAHSLYLETAAELGLVGLLLLAILVGVILATAFTARRRARGPDEVVATVGLTVAVVVFLVHASVDWIWETTGVAVLALCAVGVLGAASGRPIVRRPVPLRLLAAVVGLLALAVQLPTLVSTSKVRDSQEAVREGDLSLALADATAATEALPWGATPYVQRALVLEERGEIAAARQDALRAREREPTNWRHALVLARLDAAAGRTDDALRHFREARRLRPASPLFRAEP